MSNLDVKNNFSLKAFNTLKLESVASAFIEVKSSEEAFKIPAWLKTNGKSFFVLGGGSNVILPSQLDGLVILMNSKGISQKDSGDSVLVTASAGENWSGLVDYAARKNLFGIETLALIPGTVGASPIQNIGAYGTELKDTFESLTALNLSTGETKKFLLTDCDFTYRHSFFKREEGKSFLILDVTLRLSKKRPTSSLHPEIASELQGKEQTSQAIVDAVKNVRRRKLPDPMTLPNVGSFFLNPVFDEVTFKRLQSELPGIPHFATPTGTKVPAAWLLEKAGWKGKQLGQVGMAPTHALVLVNYGAQRSDDILSFAREVQKDVESKFGVRLEMEPSTAQPNRTQRS